MTAEPHFVQVCEEPIFIGSGGGTLACSCGHALIAGYDSARFLGVAIQCGRCAAVTTTPPLPEGTRPPFAVVVAEATAERRTSGMMLPASTYVVGRAEMDRIAELFQPHTPDDNAYLVSRDLLDQAAEAYERSIGAPLPDGVLDPADTFGGMMEHALAWAVAHLRGRLRDASWVCRESEATSAAATNVAGFLHFVRTWSHHPLFPTMAATAGKRGFSLHGLAPFAAAHCLTLQGNRIGFPTPTGFPGQIDRFFVATGPVDSVTVYTDSFDRFEYPYGRPWDATSLRSAVSEAVLGSQGRINLKNPGLLLLSPGVALGGFDEALIEAVNATMQAAGRKNRGLMAVAPVVLRMQGMADPRAVRFGYGFFPILNRHYRGESLAGAPR